MPSADVSVVLGCDPFATRDIEDRLPAPGRRSKPVLNRKRVRVADLAPAIDYS